MADHNPWANPASIPDDLIRSKELVFERCDLECSQPEPEAESAEYSAYRFEINDKKICYREAKITPTKTGQFVTLWKRNISGIIEPFDFSDPIDFAIISVRKENHFGLFIFPKEVLLEKGILSTSAKEGKRATRVYPPWDSTANKQAQKTQEWQLHYFLAISENESVVSKAKKIFGIS